MFEKKDVISEAVSRVTERVLKRKRGDVLTWEDIAALAFDRKHSHYPAFRQRLNRDLRMKHGLVLYAVYRVGLRICTKEEQLHECVTRRLQRSRRQADRGVKELAALPDGLLTAHERNVKHRKIDQTKTARRAVDYSLRLSHKLAKPTSVI